MLASQLMPRCSLLALQFQLAVAAPEDLARGEFASHNTTYRISTRARPVTPSAHTFHNARNTQRLAIHISESEIALLSNIPTVNRVDRAGQTLRGPF